jgi:hypothetical protein
LVIERPKCPFALQALNVLRTAVPLFEEKATEAAAPASRVRLSPTLAQGMKLIDLNLIATAGKNAETCRSRIVSRCFGQREFRCDSFNYI